MLGCTEGCTKVALSNVGLHWSSQQFHNVCKTAFCVVILYEHKGCTKVALSNVGLHWSSQQFHKSHFKFTITYTHSLLLVI